MAERDGLSLKDQCELTSRLYQYIFGGLIQTTTQYHGWSEAAKMIYGILFDHHNKNFLTGYEKLGLKGKPPAVGAALYHYLSNIIGGLPMEYVEESPRKAWIRYLAPSWSFPGPAICAVPGEVHRGMFRAWHARNGESLGSLRLAFVLTRMVIDGDACQEGYFEEHDRELRPYERFDYRPGIMGPEFAPDRAPRLDPKEWPPERLWKGKRNFAVEYVESTIKQLLKLYGMKHGSELVGKAFLLTTLQIFHELREKLAVESTGARGVAEFMVKVGQARGDKMELAEARNGSYVVQQKSSKLFPMADVPEHVYRATDRLYEASAEVLGRRIRIEPTRFMTAGEGYFEWRVSQ